MKICTSHKEQARERTKQWRADNPEQQKTNATEYYNKNRERELAKSKIRHQENKDVNCARAKQWRLDNPDRVAASIANRRAAKKQAIPLWANITNIRLLYKKAQQLTETSGIEYQVDHIVPLNSKIVCGLHCEDNLRVITAKENNSKNNKLIQELF